MNIKENLITILINQIEYDIQKIRDIKHTRRMSHTQSLSEYDKIRLKAYITKSNDIKNRLILLLGE